MTDPLEGMTQEKWNKLSEIERKQLRSPVNLSPQLIGKEGTIAGICKVGPRRFELVTNALKAPHDIVFGIGHELIHYHQFMRGDLDEAYERRVLIWKGVEYPMTMEPPKKGDKKAVNSYRNQPWEKEAFKYHEKLFAEVCKHLPDEDRDAVEDEYDRRMQLYQWRAIMDSLLTHRSA